MPETWKQKYRRTGKTNTTLTGWAFDEEADCAAYLSSRVGAKLRESDTTAYLQEYLVEMADTGFDTSDLEAQVELPPRAKDWEIGEAFAEVMLEDRFEAAFPWPTAWDRRTRKASLPGPDIPGFHRKESPRFLFGEVKSSSEKRWPPQVVTKNNDGLGNQVRKLVASPMHRQQLVGWLLVRAKDSAKWKPIFDEAMRQYASGDACICGILVRGNTSPTAEDLSSVQDDLDALSGTFAVLLLVFHLPFPKSQWVDLVYGVEQTN